MNRDTIQAYTNGILIGSGVADRYGEIATNDGIFFTSIADFFMYSVSEWHTNEFQKKKMSRSKSLRTKLCLVGPTKIES